MTHFIFLYHKNTHTLYYRHKHTHYIFSLQNKLSFFVSTFKRVYRFSYQSNLLSISLNNLWIRAHCWKREGERERECVWEREATLQRSLHDHVFQVKVRASVCVCVCVSERERVCVNPCLKRDREREWDQSIW